MKKKIPITLIIVGILFFAIKPYIFKTDEKNRNVNYSLQQLKKSTYNSNSLLIDTVKILNNLCDRPISSEVNGLNIFNSVPCEWKENFQTEQMKEVISAYNFIDEKENGIVAMTIKITKLPYSVSEEQRKKFFSKDGLEEIANQPGIISARKGNLSGIDCHELIMKNYNSVEAPKGAAYSLHFETIYKTKYILLAYSVAYMDSLTSKNFFYQYLPVFNALSKKFEIVDL